MRGALAVDMSAPRLAFWGCAFRTCAAERSLPASGDGVSPVVCDSAGVGLVCVCARAVRALRGARAAVLRCFGFAPRARARAVLIPQRRRQRQRVVQLIILTQLLLIGDGRSGATVERAVLRPGLSARSSVSVTVYTSVVVFFGIGRPLHARAAGRVSLELQGGRDDGPMRASGSGDARTQALV